MPQQNHQQFLCLGCQGHRRTGRGGRGGSCPPKKITKSKSRANVQHKSGEEWEIKKPKSQKAPSLLGKQRQSGNIRFTVGQYWLIIKVGQIMSILWLIWKSCLMFRKILYVRKNFWTPKMVHGGGGGEVAEINFFQKKNFRDWSGTIRKSRANFFLPP